MSVIDYLMLNVFTNDDLSIIVGLVCCLPGIASFIVGRKVVKTNYGWGVFWGFWGMIFVSRGLADIFSFMFGEGVLSSMGGLIWGVLMLIGFITMNKVLEYKNE